MAPQNPPIIPDTAPFTAEQRAWLNGFLAGLLSRAAAEPVKGTSAAGAAAVPLLVLFGSQSGNAESLAKKVAREAVGRGFAARVAGMDQVSPAALAAEPNVLVITSTWGEGDMPDNAAGFWEHLNQNGSSPSLTAVRYSVLALGDRNYGVTGTHSVSPAAASMNAWRRSARRGSIRARIATSISIRRRRHGAQAFSMRSLPPGLPPPPSRLPP
jgi:sulfite reductase alpha subunit-like flavoprotein